MRCSSTRVWAADLGCRLGAHLVADCSAMERSASGATLSVALNASGHVCAMRMSGEITRQIMGVRGRKKGDGWFWGRGFGEGCVFHSSRCARGDVPSLCRCRIKRRSSRDLLLLLLSLLLTSSLVISLLLLRRVCVALAAKFDSRSCLHIVGRSVISFLIISIPYEAPGECFQCRREFFRMTAPPISVRESQG